VLFGCYLCCSMYCLCVNVYCHRVTTQLQLINKCIYIHHIIKAYHLTLYWARWIQSMPSHRISLRPILILCYHLHLGFTNRSLDFSFPTKILHAFVFSHTNATGLPAHPPCRKQQVIHMWYCCTVSYWTISWSHCSPVYSSMELGVELMSLEPSSKFLRFVMSPGGSEPGPETNAEQINTQHRLVFRATGKRLELHLRSHKGMWGQHMYSSTHS